MAKRKSEGKHADQDWNWFVCTFLQEKFAKQNWMEGNQYHDFKRLIKVSCFLSLTLKSKKARDVCWGGLNHYSQIRMVMLTMQQSSMVFQKGFDLFLNGLINGDLEGKHQDFSQTCLNKILCVLHLTEKTPTFEHWLMQGVGVWGNIITKLFYYLFVSGVIEKCNQEALSSEGACPWLLLALSFHLSTSYCFVVNVSDSPFLDQLQYHVKSYNPLISSGLYNYSS